LGLPGKCLLKSPKNKQKVCFEGGPENGPAHGAVARIQIHDSRHCKVEAIARSREKRDLDALLLKALAKD